LDGIGKDLGSALRCALAPIVGDGWTQAQLAAVVRVLSASEHGAVERLALGNQLGAGGAEAVLALIDADILGLRCYSDWADDIKSEAWGNTPAAELITAASATCLYEMRALNQDVPTMEAAMGNAASAARPISVMEQHLRNVGGALTRRRESWTEWGESWTKWAPADNVTQGGLAGWEQKVSQLREKKTWLCKGETRLRKEETQLREDKMVLLCEQTAIVQIPCR
ncbi:hypothetical protein TSOC_006504, partial [Tetrabaena socialis]